MRTVTGCMSFEAARQSRFFRTAIVLPSAASHFSPTAGLPFLPVATSRCLPRPPNVAQSFAIRDGRPAVVVAPGRETEVGSRIVTFGDPVVSASGRIMVGIIDDDEPQPALRR